MSKKVPYMVPSSTVTDAKELKFCVQGEFIHRDQEASSPWWAAENQPNGVLIMRTICHNDPGLLP